MLGSLVHNKFWNLQLTCIFSFDFTYVVKFFKTLHEFITVLVSIDKLVWWEIYSWLIKTFRFNYLYLIFVLTLRWAVRMLSLIKLSLIKIIFPVFSIFENWWLRYRLHFHIIKSAPVSWSIRRRLIFKRLRTESPIWHLKSMIFDRRHRNGWTWSFCLKMIVQKASISIHLLIFIIFIIWSVFIFI